MFGKRPEKVYLSVSRLTVSAILCISFNNKFGTRVNYNVIYYYFCLARKNNNSYGYILLSTYNSQQFFMLLCERL